MIRVVAVLALSAAVTLASSPARADNDPDALAPHRLDPNTLERNYRRALARRNIGIAISIPGVALNILGTVLFAYGLTDGKNPNLLGQGLEIVTGAIITVIGLAIAVPGVILWITGQDSMDVLSWRRRQLTSISLRPVVTPLRDGASLGLALTF
jgi:hypothetical protein